MPLELPSEKGGRGVVGSGQTVPREASIQLYLLSILFIIAGAFHFIAPGYYRPLMPPYIPKHELIIFVSGVAEILLGALLLAPATKPFAAWAIILFLLAVLPVHVYMLQERKGKFKAYPAAFLWLRIPAQFLILWWAASNV